MKTSIKIEGLNELRLTLKRLPDALQKKTLGDAVAAGAKVIRDEAKLRAPVLTGTLRRAIRSTRGVRRGTESSAFVSVRDITRRALAKLKARGFTKRYPGDAFYWRFLEFGTAKMRAFPFLRPAFEAKKEEAARVIGKKLAEGLDAATKDARG